MMGGGKLGFTRTVKEIFFGLFDKKREVDCPGKSQFVLVVFVFSQVGFVGAVFLLDEFVGESGPRRSRNVFLGKYFLDEASKKVFCQSQNVVLIDKRHFKI